MMVKLQLILGFMAPLLQDTHNTVSRLPDIASHNTLGLYYDMIVSDLWTILLEVAASQYFLILSIILSLVRGSS
jgi:hypothetical protein